MMWRVIRSYMKYLSDDFKKISQEYEEVALGTKEEEPKWRQCLTSTAGPFGMPLGLMYVDEKFTRKSKTMVIIVKFLEFHQYFSQHAAAFLMGM